MIKANRSYSSYCTNSILLALVIVLLSCSKVTREQEAPCIASTPLQIVQTVPLEIQEPSGLSHAWEADEFLVVSDQTNTLFRIHKDGTTIKEYPFIGEDLEGVSYQETGKLIWVVEERLKKLIKLNSRGELIREYELDYTTSVDNKGLEGVAVNTNNNHIYLLNENEPAMLLEFFNGELINSFELDFALDYSGLYFESKSNSLWMVSDESKCIYKCSLKGKLQHIYTHDIMKVEGLVIDEEKNKFWVCSDSQDEIYQLEIKN